MMIVLKSFPISALSTTIKTQEITTQPGLVEAKQKSWIDDPLAVAGIIVGAVVLLVIAAIVLAKLLRKPHPKVSPDRNPLLRGSRLRNLANSRAAMHSREKDNVWVTDFDNDYMEMKQIPKLDF